MREIQMEPELSLSELKKKYQEISGSWNGSDSKFVSGGFEYHDEQAEIAQDIVDAIENVQNLIDSFEF